MNTNKTPTYSSSEEELDAYIDALNQEHRPQESNTQEIAELQSLVRAVRSFRPLQEPNIEFSRNLYQKLIAHQHQELRTHSMIQKKFLPWMALVASILVVIFLISPWSHTNKDIVLAMEQSINRLQNYHGILEKVSVNAAGERQVIQRTEIWSEGNKYATRREDGRLTVNNGATRWEIQPKSREVFLLPPYLDPHDFDLRKEASRALQYPHKTVGEELIANRVATRLEISPPGGLPYYLWIDTQSHLPIQLQTALQKSLQTTYTFTMLETNIDIPNTTFSYNLPEGYQLVDQNIDKPTTSLSEAIAMSGLSPLHPSESPQRIFASSGRIVFDLGDTVVIESKPKTPFLLDPLAALGEAEGGPLEVLPDSLRWQQNGLEIKVQGQRTEALAKQLSNSLVVTPQANQDPHDQPSIKVEADMGIVKRNQQQVDSGSSPWQLDPVQVAFTFASLQISPSGIHGEPLLAYNSLKVASNNGSDAVIQISEGPIKTVYVKRLIRKDQSGIWTVIGYDPR